MEIIAPWPTFAQEFADRPNFFARIVLPARHGKLRVIEDHGYGIVYSFYRTSRHIQGLPTEDDWMGTGDYLWLADLCFEKGARARDVVQAVRNDMLDNGFAEEGERILFWRNKANAKYGFGRVI